MNRRDWLTRSGLALGALIVGDEALDAFARLTHVRKSFPGAAVPSAWRHAHFRVAVPPNVSGYRDVIFEGSTDGAHFRAIGETGSQPLASTYTLEINGMTFQGLRAEVLRSSPLAPLDARQGSGVYTRRVRLLSDPVASSRRWRSHRDTA